MNSLSAPILIKQLNILDLLIKCEYLSHGQVTKLQFIFNKSLLATFASSVAVTPNSQLAGDLAAYNFSISFNKGINTDNRIRITFPIGFILHNNYSISKTNSNSCLRNTSFINSQIIEINTSSVCVGVFNPTIKIQDVFNPVYILLY